MNSPQILAGLSTSATALSRLAGFFASLAKDDTFEPQQVIAEIQESLHVLADVAGAFTREQAAWSEEPRVGLRMKHIAEDLDQLADRLKDVQVALQFLTGPPADDANTRRAFAVGLRSGILAAIAFAREDLTVTTRRLSALAAYHETGEVLGDETDRTDLWLEDALARYDTERPGDVIHMAGPEALRAAEPARATRPLRCRIVPVMFATDRRRIEPSSSLHVDYHDGRGDGTLVYGVAEVSIPREGRHRRGRLERPSLWKLQFREDPERHIVILTCEEKDPVAWEAIAKERIAEAGASAALVFVHGFRVTFADAIRRAAQIGYDLQFSGLVSAFSWCSEGKVLSYATDESNARLAVPRLLEFLRVLRENAGVETIHIIAHSMGNLVLLEALRRMPVPPHDQAALDEVVLAAPDYDADEFTAALGELKGKARRYTLYGSAKDLALVASKQLRSDYPRAGDGGAHLLVADGVESIDATGVGEDLLGLGHSYFASKRTVLSDLFYVIQESFPPNRRIGLEERQRGTLKYWVFAP